DQAAADVGVDARRAFNHQRPGGRVVAQGVQEFGAEPVLLFILTGALSTGRVQGRRSRPLEETGPLPLAWVADNLPDQFDEDLALVAALEAELAAQVPQLSELAAAQAELAAAGTKVDLAALAEAKAA